MTLTEAKEQIAKKYNFENWSILQGYFQDDDDIISYLEESFDLVLSSKDKEIESLTSEIKRLEVWHTDKQGEINAEALSSAIADAKKEIEEKYLKEIAELKDLNHALAVNSREMRELSTLTNDELLKAKNTIQSLQEEIQNEQEAHIKTLQQHTGELKKAQKIIMDLSEEMKKKEDKVKKWDKLDEEIGKFYDEGSELGGLDNIGEVAARHLGYL